MSELRTEKRSDWAQQFYYFKVFCILALCISYATRSKLVTSQGESLHWHSGRESALAPMFLICMSVSFLVSQEGLE